MRYPVKNQNNASQTKQDASLHLIIYSFNFSCHNEVKCNKKKKWKPLLQLAPQQVLCRLQTLLNAMKDAAWGWSANCNISSKLKISLNEALKGRRKKKNNKSIWAHSYMHAAYICVFKKPISFGLTINILILMNHYLVTSSGMGVSAHPQCTCIYLESIVGCLSLGMTNGDLLTSSSGRDIGAVNTAAVRAGSGRSVLLCG